MRSSHKSPPPYTHTHLNWLITGGTGGTWERRAGGDPLAHGDKNAPAVSKDDMTREDTCPLTVRNETRREASWGISSHPAEQTAALAQWRRTCGKAPSLCQSQTRSRPFNRGASAGEWSHVRLEVEVYKKKRRGGRSGRQSTVDRLLIQIWFDKAALPTGLLRFEGNLICHVGLWSISITLGESGQGSIGQCIATVVFQRKKTQNVKIQ